MNANPAAEALGTTLVPDAHPLVGLFFAYAFALAAAAAIGWGLYIMYKRRNRSAQRESLHSPRAS